MFHQFPYTDFHELNLDYLMKCCGKGMGLRLDLQGDYLRLVNQRNEVVSQVKVHYADTALTDIDGKPIQTYIFDAGVDGTHIVFTHGDNTITSITVPYSETAAKDVQNKNILDYVYGISVAGDAIRITKGDATVIDITVPYAVKASNDAEGKDITTYAATLEVDGDELVLRDSKGRQLSRITVEYAVKAKEDIDGDDIKSTYGNSLVAGTTTVKMLAKDLTLLSEITVPYATMALTDTDGNAFLSDYVTALVVDGQRIGVEAHDGTRLSTITVPFATLATDATNAIETIQIIGDQMVFTTFGGQNFAITAPYAVKAQKDDLGNTIKNTYIASVVNDEEDGSLIFYDAVGNIIANLIPTVHKASHDYYNNLIADYIKSIVVDNQSNYVLATHGTGTVDSLVINYSNTAWKDTNNNVIKNTYIKYMECVEDVDDGHFKLVCYDGDNPMAELFRVELKAYMAQVDVNERAITSYIGGVEVNDNDDIDILDGEGNVVNTVYGAVGFTPTGDITGTTVTLGTTTEEVIDSVGTLPSKTADSYTPGSKAADSYTPGSKAADVFVAPSLSYDSQTEELTFNPGSFTEGVYTPGSFTEGAYTPGSFTEGTFDPGTLPSTKQITVADGTATVVEGTFSGDPVVANVTFTD